MSYDMISIPRCVNRSGELYVEHELAEIEQQLAHYRIELAQVRAQLVHETEARCRIQSELVHANQILAASTTQLERSRNLLRTLFDALSDGLLLLDGSGTILAVNRPLAHLFGFAIEQVIGQSWSALVSYSGFEVPGRIILQTLYDGRARRRRETCKLAGGRHAVLDLQTLALIGTSGSAENIILHLVDVTEQLQSETLDLQNERLAASAQLVATIAHELNTPLLSIQSCLFLAEQSADEGRSTYLGLAREEIDRIAAILRQLLDLHRPDAGERAPVAVNALIERVLLLIGGTIAEHHITVERDLSSAQPVVSGFPGQLTQVLLNLLMNAIAAMPEHGWLTIQTAIVAHAPDPRIGWVDPTPLLAPPLVQISITDTGGGIAPDLHADIFKPFFTTRTMGTGLGLAICRQIVRRHGGMIGLTSALGQGSTFTIMLPAAKDRME
jgi:PAS domain S-box-containing protein